MRSFMEGLESCPLDESTTFLKFALRAAQAGSWACDLVTGETFWSDEYYLLIGTDRETLPPSYDGWLRSVHPEDRELAERQVQEAFAGRGDLNVDFRILRPDGVRWLRSRGQVLYGENGEPLRLAGVAFDITEHKQTEEALRRREEELRIIANGLPVLISYVDAEERYRFVNARYESWFGRPLEAIEGKLVHSVIGDAAYQTILPHLRSVLSGQEVRFNASVEYEGVGQRWVEARYVPHFAREGHVLGFFALVTDITEHKRTEQALQESDRRKDEFLAMLAHELRNPLAPIHNAVQVMRHLGLRDPQLDRMRGVIERQTDQLTRMVDDLLDVSRISQGKISLRKEPIDLVAVVGRAVETSRPLIDAGGHRLIVSLPPEALQIEGDASRLAQVLSNLLNNAAKYTESGGEISLTAERKGSEVELRVKDNGIGMPPDVLPRVFDLFAQADRALDRAQGGLGIGLTLVRSLVEMHGGTVKAFSEGQGKGSELTVRLPLLAPRAFAEAAERGRDSALPSSPRCRVLVVDDNVDSAQSLSLLLTIEGHDVRMAHDGREGIEIARDFQPQVVLLDIGLPQMSGYEVAVHLRGELALHGAVFIALTGYGQPEDRQRSKDAGFDHHLVKPVDFEELRNLIVSHGGCG